VRADSVSFRDRGEFLLDLVPTGKDGRSLVQEAWTVTLGGGTGSVLSQAVRPRDTAAAAVVILIDDSPSMRFSDPERYRAEAARQFWTEVLALRPHSRIALADFGGGPPSEGFQYSRLLQPLTGDAALLEARLGQVVASTEFGTPLFRSATEVVGWLDAAAPREGIQRWLVIMTDGEPSDASTKTLLFEGARQAGVRVVSIGLGSASDRDPTPNQAAVQLLRETATETGGLYGGVVEESQLVPLLQAFGRSSTEDRLEVVVRTAPPVARGTIVEGSVTLEGGPGRVSGRWSFVAP
jgi:Mg-chelatase subunit ChlD